ncbi:MAG: hypothetical protein KDB07_09170, partial [Planctomycetes bacterium]|nr:hypothetical protein [Planctomycetota bacterium]
MFVKKMLIFMPIAFLIFLAQSVFWVPMGEAVASNESRLNRHIIYLSGDPSSMNPRISGSATDSDVYAYIIESLFTSDGNFRTEYELCDRAQIREEIVIYLDPKMDEEAIISGLDAHLKERYPDTFDRIDGSASYRKHMHQGWTDNRYIVDLSEGKAIASNAVPDSERLVAHYRPDTSKPEMVEDGIRRIVVHFRPDPNKEYDYVRNELPSAIAKEFDKALDEYFKANQGVEGFSKHFDGSLAALNWYRAKHELEPTVIAALNLAETKPEEAQPEGDKPEEVQPEGDKPDGDGNSESNEDKPAESKNEANGAETDKAAESKASEEAPKKLSKEVVTKFIKEKLEASLKKIAEANKDAALFAATLNAIIERTLLNESQEPKAELIEAWFKAEFEKLAASLEEAQSKAGKENTFAAYLNTAPKARLNEFPVVDMHLREGVKWHDYGTERNGKEIKETFDAADVAFSFAFGHHPDVNSKRKSYSQSIRQIRIHDDHNIDFVYSGVYSPAIKDLAAANVIPEHRFFKSDWIKEAKGKGLGPTESDDLKTFNFVRNFPPEQLRYTLDPVGTGPMKLMALNGNQLPMWQSGELVRLERNDDYWNPANRPLFQYLDFYVFDPDLGMETAEVVFLSGGTDLFAVKPHQVEKFASDRSEYYLYKRPNLSYEYIAFNMKRDIFKDIRVRQALALAIDVDLIVEYVVFGQAQRINQPAYPMLPYYDDEFIPDYTFRQGPNKGKTLREAGMKALPFDLEEARALLDEAGFKNPGGGIRAKGDLALDFKILNGGNDSSTRGKIAMLAIEQWKKIGVNAKFEGKEFNVFLQEHIYPQNFDCVTLGWSGGTSFDKRQLWHSDNAQPNQLNFVYYKDDESDKIMDELLTTYDEDEQIAMARKLNARIANQQPYIFLFSPLTNMAVTRSLYWAKPVYDAMGNPVLGEDGKVKREQLPLNHETLMGYKYGPRTERMQFARSEK